MDRPLKAVPDKLFHNIHRQYDKVVCSNGIVILEQLDPLTVHDDTGHRDTFSGGADC